MHLKGGYDMAVNFKIVKKDDPELVIIEKHIIKALAKIEFLISRVEFLTEEVSTLSEQVSEKKLNNNHKPQKINFEF
jgi:hypothetical protein